MTARRHVILMGLPGAGKTTAGSLAARQLGAPHVDIDVVIERQTGKSVAEIFEREGEASFRRQERESLRQVLAGPPAIVTPGGGWAQHDPDFGPIRERACLILLEVSPHTAADRMAGKGKRPLLSGTSPMATLAYLLEQRRPFYDLAHASVDTESQTPEAVASSVVGLARQHAGW
ncbi:MAG: shikimate kinase [Gemmatimonadales bacterium]